VPHVRLKPLTVNNTEIKLTDQLLIINNRLHSKHDMATFGRATLLTLHRGADKSLARPTYRCRRTESIVSLEA